MNYTTIVLTHGRDKGPLEETIRTFMAHVEPKPKQMLIVEDSDEQGFCAATGLAWAAGVQSGTEFVFHLEHDFRFIRPVNLLHLSHVLAVDSSLSQMSLMRQPVNPAEMKAGSVVATFAPGTFARSEYLEGQAHLPFAAKRHPYLTHTAYFTTNPSLMRRRFMEENPWPVEYGAKCEGLFGMDLSGRGYRSGIWGDGETWVEHFGERSGHGY